MPPLVYVIFNRPDLVARSFEAVRKAKPSVLFVAADGPRADRDEASLCRECRSIAEQVDWDCDIRKLFSDENLGCAKRISSAITHVLAEFESAIILEDDCLPDPSFFGFCETLLDRYADDSRVMAVSGNNYQQGIRRGGASYYFSKYPHCWGWATWRRAWNSFDPAMDEWPELRSRNILENFCTSKREIDYWTFMFDQIHAGKVDSWAMPWTLRCWLQNGLTVLPARNLVSNVGFDDRATNTTGGAACSGLPTFSMESIQHRTEVFADRIADQYTDDLLYSGPWADFQKHYHSFPQRLRRSIEKRKLRLTGAVRQRVAA